MEKERVFELLYMQSKYFIPTAFIVILSLVDIASSLQEAPMDGCTDGVCLWDGVHYFVCPPNKGYFCLLEQLVPDQWFMASSKALNNRKLCVFATNPPPPPPTFCCIACSF